MPLEMLVGGTRVLVAADLWALVLALASLLVPFAFREVREDARTTLAIWLGTLLHHVLAVVNVFLGKVYGADQDAVGFHRAGVAFGKLRTFELGIGSDFYEQFLGLVYRQLGASQLLGSELSILAFALAACVVAEVASELGVARHRFAIVLGFSCLPATIIQTSVTLREPFQLLFFAAATLFALRFMRHRSTGNFLGAVASVLALAVWHKGLLLFVPVLPMLAMAWPASERPKGPAGPRMVRRVLQLGLGVVVLLGIGRLGARLATSGAAGTELVRAVGSARALQFADQYRRSAINQRARADYGVTIDISSPTRLVMSVPAVYVHYLFAPFPWQIRAAVDVYGAGEALMRLVLLLAAVASARRARGGQRRARMFCLTMFGVMTFLWALGTVNYGTALRHHIVSNWLLFVLGLPPLLEALGGARRRAAVARDRFAAALAADARPAGPVA